MAVGDSSLATSPGLSQDSLNFEPMRSAEPLALGAMEPPAHLSRLLASRKLEQVLERSCQLPTSSASLSHYRSPKPPSNPECEMPLFGAGGQEATEAESDLEAGLEEAEVVSANSQAWDGDAPAPQLLLPGALSGWGFPYPSLMGCVRTSCLTPPPAVWRWPGPGPAWHFAWLGTGRPAGCASLLSLILPPSAGPLGWESG